MSDTPPIVRIAGHWFEEAQRGRVCRECGKSWIAILDQREFWKVGEMNIAHSGSLSAFEVAQLRDELDRIWATVG